MARTKATRKLSSTFLLTGFRCPAGTRRVKGNQTMCTGEPVKRKPPTPRVLALQMDPTMTLPMGYARPIQRKRKGLQTVSARPIGMGMPIAHAIQMGMPVADAIQMGMPMGYATPIKRKRKGLKTVSARPIGMGMPML